MEFKITHKTSENKNFKSTIEVFWFRKKNVHLKNETIHIHTKVLSKDNMLGGALSLKKLWNCNETCVASAPRQCCPPSPCNCSVTSRLKKLHEIYAHVMISHETLQRQQKQLPPLIFPGRHQLLTVEIHHGPLINATAITINDPAGHILLLNDISKEKEENRHCVTLTIIMARKRSEEGEERH